MAHIVGSAGSLLAFWLLMSGIYTPLLITLGVLSVLLVLYIQQRMELHDRETFPIHLRDQIFRYWGWLAGEIFKANLDVARIILSPSMKISPRIVRVKARQKSDLGKVIFANSITLTPGTVSVEIEDDEIIVHALTTGLATGTVSGDMGARVCAFEE